MRILLILIFAVFSLGAMATFEGARKTPDNSGSKLANAQTGTLTGAVSFVRKAKAHLSADGRAQTWSEPSARGQDTPRLQIGDVPPEGAVLYVVPRHESYRYTIVNGRRVIVDAASRQIVYVIE
ncbi:DUF1236 domain-containing protein [Microvirga vignae]|uniref:DUF1236 domain-containing protein n=1 Tax=Microvirga vignae TaxID=1225564 RepID=UPI0006998FCB|nr:DUF1236 domain-containing protein [Microvirga vignae]